MCPLAFPRFIDEGFQPRRVGMYPQLFHAFNPIGVRYRVARHGPHQAYL